jgi:hypothetical protein
MAFDCMIETRQGSGNKIIGVSFDEDFDTIRGMIFQDGSLILLKRCFNDFYEDQTVKQDELISFQQEVSRLGIRLRTTGYGDLEMKVIQLANVALYAIEAGRPIKFYAD